MITPCIVTKINPDRQDHYSGSQSIGDFHAAKAGGQHVNKTNSRAELRIDIQQTDFLSPAVTKRLRTQAGNRVTTAGELVLTSQRFREQNRNINDCLEKLSALLIKALALPKTRRATQPTRASKTRRLEKKKHRSATKKLRQKIMD